MKNRKGLILLLLGLALAAAPAVAVHAQEGPWMPQEPQGHWSHAWHSGFHDGVDAARHDIDARRPPDPARHDKYRHPDLPHDQRPDFRAGFERGYRMVYDHEGHNHDHDWDHPGF